VLEIYVFQQRSAGNHDINLKQRILPNASVVSEAISDSPIIITPLPSPCITLEDLGLSTNVTVSLTEVPFMLPVNDKGVSMLGLSESKTLWVTIIFSMINKNRSSRIVVRIISINLIFCLEKTKCKTLMYVIQFYDRARKQ
jgi:hypothetical protein